MTFEQNVFINCPIDDEYAPLLDATLFCIVYAGLSPRLSSERLESGQNRLEKIIDIAANCRFSIHDLSRCRCAAPGEFARMNMPFELGLDFGLRRSAAGSAKKNILSTKRFLIFEQERFDTKVALSDLAGQDVDFHNGHFVNLIHKLRNFLHVEANCSTLPGPDRLIADYEIFQAWFVMTKSDDGHAMASLKSMPVIERLSTMKAWFANGKPSPPRP